MLLYEVKIKSNNRDEVTYKLFINNVRVFYHWPCPPPARGLCHHPDPAFSITITVYFMLTFFGTLIKLKDVQAWIETKPCNLYKLSKLILIYP